MGRRILHLADLHLGFGHDYLGDSAGERGREADAVLDRVASWLLGPSSPDVGAVLIAGDLFETPYPDEAVVEKAAGSLRRLEEAEIHVVTVPGNHDEWTYPDGVFRRHSATWPGTLVRSTDPERVAILDLDGQKVEVGSCAFHQGRNRPSNKWENPFSAERDPSVRRIGLFHGTLDRIGGKVAEGERAFRLGLDHLSEWGLDYLALGHIHKRCEFISGSCLAHYPGPIEGKGYTDPGSKYLSIVDLRGSVPKIESVDARAIGVRSRDVGQIRIDLAGIADRAHLEREIASLAVGTPPIVQVVLEGRAPFTIPIDETRRRLAPKFRSLEIATEEPGVGIGDWESLAGQRTLEGLLARRIIEARGADGPEKARFWNLVAEEGLGALGRGEA